MTGSWPAGVRGIGIHTGEEFEVSLEAARSQPATEAPISFVCTFEANDFEAPALWTRLSATARSTSIVLRGPSRLRFELKTIEHLLAAAHAAGFPSLRLRVRPVRERSLESAPLEIPVLDGSASGWMDMMRDSLMVEEWRPVWLPVRSYVLEDGDKSVIVSPLEPLEPLRTEYACSVDFGAGLYQQKSFTFDWSKPLETFEAFAREIAPARTFGFRHELESLAARNLARGGSLANAILIDEGRVVNVGGLRIPDELAAHKLLDAVGDFALLGAPILGRVTVHKAGHSMHLRAVEEAVRTGALVKARLYRGQTLVR